MALVELGAPDRNVVGVRTWRRSVVLAAADDEISVVIPRGAGHILALALSGVESMLPVVGTAAVPTGVDVLYTETAAATTWRLPEFTRIPARPDLGKPSILVVRPDLQGAPTLPATVIVQIETAERGALDDETAEALVTAAAYTDATLAAALVAYLLKAGGAMTGVLTLSSGHSANALALAYWRGLVPVTRTYTAFGMGAAAPTVRAPDCGGMTCDYTTATTLRLGGAFTPVDPTAAAFGARHRMRMANSGAISGQNNGFGVKINGGTDIYAWTMSAQTWYRGHETAGVPGVVSLGTVAPNGLEQTDVEIFVPTRATVATAVTVTIKGSVDGFKTSFSIDSLSIAPSDTGLAGSNIGGHSYLAAELWSAA